MLTIPLMLAAEIKLESLADGPGLLPYKLGPMRLTTHYHTYLQHIDLQIIEDKINLTYAQLQTYKNRLTNDTYLLFENQLDYLLDNLDKVKNQLKSLEPLRAKRGLVDGIGSIIKSITGNLDHSDAENYDSLIKNLQANQGKMASELNSHVSLNKEWISRQNIVLDTLVENQKKINATLELILENNAYGRNSLVKYAKIAQLFSIFRENVEDLRLELIRIEDCLAFIRVSRTHHSMLDINVIKNMIDNLRSIYGVEAILDLELREYYDIIRPSFQYIKKQIVIIFQFPIVSETTYDLLKLTIVPNRHNQALIPSHPLIATHDNSFMYMEAECPKLSCGYLCEKGSCRIQTTTSDCIHRLITKQDLLQSCQLTRVSLSKPAMEKLDDQHFVISFPQSTKVQLSCGREDYNLLEGSYLITVPHHCYLRTSEFTITNENDEVQGHPLKLAEVPEDIINQAAISTRINLKSVDLKQLHNTQSKLLLETPLHLETNRSDSLYHTTLPLYVIIAGACALGIVIIKRRYNLWGCEPRNSPESDSNCKKTKETLEEAEGAHTQDKLPAIFSLSVGK